MKVLMVNVVCGIRSTGRICTDIADLLIAQGHECKIAYGRETVPDKYKDIAVRIGNDTDVRIHALRSRILDNSGFSSRKATEKFIKWIREYDPDVIHLHNIHGYYINTEILFDYLKTCGKKTIWTLHDCWAFTGHCSHFTMAKCEQWKTQCLHCSQIRNYPACYTCGNVKRNFQRKKAAFTGVPDMHIVTPSKWLANVVKDSFLREYPIEVINNGIDLNAFKPTKSDFREKYRLQNKTIILGVASVWSEGKGFNDFLKLSKMIDHDSRIVLVGVNRKQLKILPKNIIGIERTNGVKELAEIYSAADVFVNPSRQETMGLVSVEAMACGTPVVVSNLTAVPEVVTPDGGIVLEELSAEAIKCGIEKAMKMPFDPRKNAGMFEKRSNYIQYLDLYNSLQDKFI